MPKTLINYANTIMYKLVCNDLNITGCYVGHTTNFIKRKASHKERCSDPNNKKYHLKIYKMIRENGDWCNWSMVMIEEYPCKNKQVAVKRERELFESLESTLNTYYPCRTKQEYYNDNKEQFKTWHKKYHDEHIEEIVGYQKEYRETHQEEAREYKKKWYENNEDRLSKERKEFRKTNPEESKQRDKRAYEKKQQNRVCCEVCGLEMMKKSLLNHNRAKHN